MGKFVFILVIIVIVIGAYELIISSVVPGGLIMLGKKDNNTAHPVRVSSLIVVAVPKIKALSTSNNIVLQAEEGVTGPYLNTSGYSYNIDNTSSRIPRLRVVFPGIVTITVSNCDDPLVELSCPHRKIFSFTLIALP